MNDLTPHTSNHYVYQTGSRGYADFAPGSTSPGADPFVCRPTSPGTFGISNLVTLALSLSLALVRMVLEGENPVLVPVAALQDDASVWPGSALYETGCCIYNNFLKYFKKYFEIC